MNILVATDVRFWQRNTGAEQRIFELVRYLHQHVSAEKHGCVTIAFVGSIGPIDRNQIERYDFKVDSLIEDWQPQGWLQTCYWHVRCTINAMRMGSPHRRPSNEPAGSATPTKRLADFESAEMKYRFQQLIQQIKPQVVIVEYITLAYLIPPREQRCGVVYAVDTHDCLASRCQQFREHGYTHWVELTYEEEAAALDVFDVVIAIQSQEASSLKQMITNGQPVIAVGHAVSATAIATIDLPGEHKITVGMLASDNAANRHALQWFFKSVWTAVIATQPKIGFLMAGSICDQYVNRPPPYNCRCLGRVEQVADFYQCVDIVINPVQFGTGLKIKNVEAIGFGRPLVTTLQGTHNRSDLNADGLPCLVARTADEMVQHLLKLSEDTELRTQLSRSASQFAVNELSPEKTYAPLVDLFSKHVR